MQEGDLLMISERFRMRKPTLALTELSGQRTTMYFDTGATVILVDGSPNAVGLVNVRWDARTALMFDSDLRERAELVRFAGAAA
jgi:hypothetical protein